MLNTALHRYHIYCSVKIHTALELNWYVPLMNTAFCIVSPHLLLDIKIALALFQTQKSFMLINQFLLWTDWQLIHKTVTALTAWLEDSHESLWHLIQFPDNCRIFLSAELCCRSQLCCYSKMFSNWFIHLLNYNLINDKCSPVKSTEEQIFC